MLGVLAMYRRRRDGPYVDDGVETVVVEEIHVMDDDFPERRYEIYQETDIVFPHGMRPTSAPQGIRIPAPPNYPPPGIDIH